MARFTTTISEYLNSELDRIGKSEFVVDDKLVFYDEDYQYIQKILRYDDDVHNVVTAKIFKGFEFQDIQVDKNFKKSFITHFLDREIGRQTIEAFSSQVLYVTLTHEDYIKYTYSHLFDDYLTGLNTGESHTVNENLSESESTSKDTSTNESVNADRNATATLPQSEVNTNVDNDELRFADENTISKSKSNSSGVSDGTRNSNDKQNGTSDTTNKSNNYDIEVLNKAFDMKEKIFNVFDKKCFLHIW